MNRWYVSANHFASQPFAFADTAVFVPESCDVETVAMALWDHDELKEAEFWEHHNMLPWQDTRELDRIEYRDRARAVLGSLGLLV